MSIANTDETIVHVCDPTGCGEYTMCGLEMSEGSVDPAESRGDPQYGLHEVKGRKPNCKECKDRIKQLREAFRGIRFAKRLVTIDETMIPLDEKQGDTRCYE